MSEKTYTWTPTQNQRLRELGMDETVLTREFPTAPERDKTFQGMEKQRVKEEKAKLHQRLADGGASRMDALKARLTEALTAEGFIRVTTPTLISKHALAKMTVDENHPLFNQVYWVSNKQCLRPMLAPNLYSLMMDFSRQKKWPVRFFEIGSCFRKESDGSRHNSEFTMLNLVEMGLPEEERAANLKRWAELVAKTAGLTDHEYESEDSKVYGSTLDMVAGPNKVEVASGAMGPHALDDAWGIHDTWVGMGFGLERLLMISQGDSYISKWCKNLSYMDGIQLKI